MKTEYLISLTHRLNSCKSRQTKLIRLFPNVANNLSPTTSSSLHDHIQVFNFKSDVLDAVAMLDQMLAELDVVGVVWRDEHKHNLAKNRNLLEQNVDGSLRCA